MSDRFTVIGSIGADPDRRTTKGGDPYITFSVASNERRKDEDGTWSDVATSWFDVTAFGALARHAGDALHRGDRVIVHGDLTVAQYTTSAGGKGRAVKIRATAIGHDLTVGGPRVSRAQAAQHGQHSQHGHDGEGDSRRPDPQVDHSAEWAPITLHDGAAASSSSGADIEPDWMTTPF